MAYIDYYKALGVAKTATQDEIKKAYKTLARKYHPDLNPDNAEAKKKFQEINEANEVLSDPDRRKKYDRYGENWKHADQFEAAGIVGPLFGHCVVVDHLLRHAYFDAHATGVCSKLEPLFCHDVLHHLALIGWHAFHLFLCLCHGSCHLARAVLHLRREFPESGFDGLGTDKACASHQQIGCDCDLQFHMVFPLKK